MLDHSRLAADFLEGHSLAAQLEHLPFERAQIADALRPIDLQIEPFLIAGLDRGRLVEEFHHPLLALLIVALVIEHAAYGLAQRLPLRRVFVKKIAKSLAVVADLDSPLEIDLVEEIVVVA